eukprot:TRINITY_DN7704_c0_g1_i1.p1 TRINITY_DN7704_c0_g1~~TRINITY_DN7704_c0_g1_i1.p1  ORF type:complete len:119 (-),score=20.64 TRINITY_DN7704_c0_g1_i1:53-409(-)
MNDPNYQIIRSDLTNTIMGVFSNKRRRTIIANPMSLITSTSTGTGTGDTTNPSITRQSQTSISSVAPLSITSDCMASVSRALEKLEKISYTSHLLNRVVDIVATDSKGPSCEHSYWKT